ncbi:interleukin-17 receptor B-like isoform X1 [Carassius auratus]|uniref:Interleukin-17 receptor B-like isoform X1 n=1 Tax=Carassius auratus TaxID=7957 RepID=A0A6P6PYQ5_CARAU|nr:interleukin-17 receptor B-like isoform X1 [Carassius auratus]
MELLDCMREIVAFFFLIQWTTSDNSSLSIVATCKKDEHAVPTEWYTIHESNPSPLNELSAELIESQTSIIIRWSINIDSSFRSLIGTWITVSEDSDSYYRCEYQPPFTSERINLTGQEQLWFHFIVPNVAVCPSTSYYISAYNIPTPSGGANTEYIKMAQTAEIQWNADIHSVLHGDKIVVTFNTSLVAERHTIILKNSTQRLLKTDGGKGECKVEKCEVELEYMEYMGPCEDLEILILPHFTDCHEESEWKVQKVSCTSEYPVTHLLVSLASLITTILCLLSGCFIPDRSALDIVGCVLALLFVLLCCFIICQTFRWVRGSRRAASVRVLLVYPAIDSVFQRSVMLLAESLQSRGGVRVVIDVWERRSLAEQGPLRWLNTQADLSDRVLLISPPQRTYTDDLKSKLVPGVPDDTVSASASNLFALALNLVTSAAHDPHSRDKFWVISLEHDEKSVQTELRGCRMFVLPRDLKKLHLQLLSGAIQSPVLPRCFYCKNTLEQLEVNTDFPSCVKRVSLAESDE